MRTSTALVDGAGRVLFGRLRGQVLALLMVEPSHRFYLREMVRLTGSSPGALQREVGILTKAGLVLRERRGRQVYYRANASAPVFPELRGLVRKTMSGIDILRSALASLADRVKAAVVFGSMARGELGPSSDIDLLVVGDVELSEVLEALKPAEEALGREIRPVVYLPSEYRRRRKEKRHFVEAVVRGPRSSIIGELDSAGEPPSQRVLRVTSRDRVRELRASIKKAARASGARNVRLFGSAVRGEDTENSDLDFLVSLEPGRTLLDLARLELSLERLLGRPVDVVTEESLRGPVRRAALREAIRV